MMEEGKKEIFEKAKAALIKLGIYSDDKERGDKSKISGVELDYSLDFAIIGRQNVFRKAAIYPGSIPDENIRIACRKNKHYLSHTADFEDINEFKNRISESFPVFEKYGIIDRNELTFGMMEEVYKYQTERNYRYGQEAFNKGIRTLQLVPVELESFLNGVWRQHASEYVIAKSILDELGIDVKEEDVKKLWEERKLELFKGNNPDPISIDAR